MKSFWAGFVKQAEIKQVATVGIVNIDGRRLLMGKRRDNDKWTTPGGHLERNEDPISGAVREVQEETGLEIGEDDLIKVRTKNVVKPDGTKLKVHAFKAYISGQSPKASNRNDPDKEVSVWRWVKMKGGLPAYVAKNLHVPMKHNALLPGLNFRKTAMKRISMPIGRDEAQKIINESLQYYAKRKPKEKKAAITKTALSRLEAARQGKLDLIPGGKADHVPDSAFPKKDLERGQKFEREHTSDTIAQREIAKDHLMEGHNYYELLEQMEKKLEKKGFWEGFSKRAFAEKRPYKDLDIKKLEPSRSDEIWTAKIDGAHTVVKMIKGRPPQLFSHRTSKRTGEPISYNQKITHIVNKSPVTGVFRAETYAVDRKGRAVHPDVVTALLNRSPERSLEMQKELGIRTRTALIDVDSLGDDDLSQSSYADKRKVLEAIVKKSRDFILPATARSSKAKRRLLEQILSGDHPQTKEGIVVHSRSGPQYSKAKITDDHDVYVREIFHEAPTKESREKGMAAGFRYSWEPHGPIAGKVGTGFSHALKREMAKNPGKFLGMAARVKAHDVSKNRTLVKPSFVGWHVEKNIKAASEDWAKQTIIVSKDVAKDRDEAKAMARRFADRIYTSRETSSSYRFRQKPPKAFVPGSYRVKSIPEKGITLVYGRLI